MANEVLIPAEGSASVVTFLVKIDGEAIPQTFEVSTLAVTKEVNRIPRAKVILIDGDAAAADFPASNEELFIPGKEIELFAGFESQEEKIFQGLIVKHGLKINAAGQSMLKLECMDAAFQTTLARKNRYFSEVLDSDAIEDILGEYDLSPEVDPTEVNHQEMVQYETSDFDFIVTRAEANGRLCFISDGVFAIKAPDTSPEPVLTLRYGDTLLEFEAEIDVRDQYPAVKSQSWDYVNQELLEVEGADPGIEEGGNLSASDLSAIGGLASYDLRHSGQVVEEELQAWADACLLRSRLAKIKGRAKFQGFAGVVPGDMVSVEGVGERFSGKAFVSGVRHHISEGSWTTDVQLGLSAQWFAERIQLSPPPASSLLSGVEGLQVGIVTALEGDPDEENRILVKVPVISTEEEGIWARIATLDAGTGDGEGRGTFFLPEIDDEVIVGFINGDPRDPVVLGMMHSSGKPAPLSASDDNHEKGIITRSDMKLLFNDETKTMQMETPAGKKVMLDEDQGVIQLEDENGNKIVMDSSGIVIESASDLVLKAGANLQAEGSANVEMKAGASFKAEGSAGAEVSTSAIAVLKGSLVQIN
ncbi:MAG: type VI secretion system tip protein VgrG [Bacteroidota bacterium]